MKVDIEDRSITVELTRRNLETLLAKLDGNPPDSLCTIAKGEPSYGWVYVRAVENEAHYSDRPAGRMHPNTEASL